MCRPGLAVCREVSALAVLEAGYENDPSLSLVYTCVSTGLAVAFLRVGFEGGSSSTRFTGIAELSFRRFLVLYRDMAMLGAGYENGPTLSPVYFYVSSWSCSVWQ